MQLCQIEHTPWISISYTLFFVFFTIWQSCPIFIKYIQKKKEKMRDSMGGFRNRGKFVKFAKRMYPAPVSRRDESKPTRDAPCARTATRRVITILTLWKEPRIYWFSMYVTKGNIGFRTYSSPGELAIETRWYYGELGSWQAGSFQAGFLVSRVHFTLGSTTY